jgi:hypothetical protein
MGFFKDAGESLFKYSEKLVNKTEEYAKIAKLTMDIKRYENNIEKIHAEIGAYIKKLIGQGETTINLEEQYIKEKSESIDEINKNIENKRREITEIKKEKSSGNQVQTESRTDESQT